MATVEATTTNTAQLASTLNLLHLNDDVRDHILARVPLADHPSVALVCKEFRGVINDPRFLKTISVVADGKLFVIDTWSSEDLLVYDRQSETWTEEAPPPIVTNPDDGDVWITVSSACAHKNRLVVFLSSGRAFERANDGSWSPLEFAAALSDDDLVESVILG